jgi:hypothetical protein
VATAWNTACLPPFVTKTFSTARSKFESRFVLTTIAQLQQIHQQNLK